MNELNIGPFRFSTKDRENQIDIYFIAAYYGENCYDSYMDESEAASLVGMILEKFPKIRERLANGSKP